MAMLERPAHHRPLAASILKRAVFDLTSRSRHAVDAWHWFFAEPAAPQGWDFEDAALVLELSVPHLRRALIRAGFQRPPQAMTGTQRGKVAGIIPCRVCGEAVPTPDVRIQRTCPSCGDSLKPKYLRRHGLLPRHPTPPPSRQTYAQAALQQLLRHGPLPVTYCERHLRKVGCTKGTIARARLALGCQAIKVGHSGPWMVKLSRELCTRHASPSPASHVAS